MPKLKLTPQLISAAIDGYESQKARIDIQLAELRAMLSGGSATSTGDAEEPPTRKRRTMSAAARKAISEATKKRWAAFHAAKEADKPEQVEPEKVAPKKAAAKTPPAKPAKKNATAKKAMTKKTSPVAAPDETEVEGQ